MASSASTKDSPPPKNFSASDQTDIGLLTAISVTERKAAVSQKSTPLKEEKSKSTARKSIQRGESAEKSNITKQGQQATPSANPISKSSSKKLNLPEPKRKTTIEKPALSEKSSGKSMPWTELKKMEFKQPRDTKSTLAKSTLQKTASRTMASPTSQSKTVLRSRGSSEEKMSIHSRRSSKPVQVQISSDQAPPTRGTQLAKSIQPPATASPPAPGPIDGDEYVRGRVSKGSKIMSSTSLSKMMSNRLGKGQFTRGAGLVGFGFCLMLIIYTFIGSAVFNATDGHSPNKWAPWPCDYDRIANCSNVNASMESASTKADTNETTSAINDSMWECADVRRKETWRNLDDCLFKNHQNVVPGSYPSAISYTMTVVSTVGYADVAGMGQSLQATMILFSLFVIPMFFDFFAFITELLRNEWALIFDGYVKRHSKKKPLFARLLSNYPDLIPFLILVLISSAYLFAVAGILYGSVGEFDGYFSAFYYLVQSVFMIGFGDQAAHDYDYHLKSGFFVIVGIVMVTLVQIVMEEWMTRPVISVVDHLTLGEKEKPIAEQTVGEIMETVPNDLPKQVDGAEINRPSSSKQLRSVHLRQFRAARFFRDSCDDDIFHFEEILPQNQ